MAQFGRALRSGRRGRRFKSCRIDEKRAHAEGMGSFFINPIGREPAASARANLGTQRVQTSGGRLDGSNPVASTKKKTHAEGIGSYMMYHALFDMEDFHGLHPVKREDGYYLEFSGHTALDQRITKFTFKEFLEKWYEMRQKCLPNSSDTPEEKAAREKEYALWKGEYPQNVARETAERMRDILREQRLQAELDELYAKRNSEAEFKRIDKALEPILPEVKASYIPIEKESDFIFLIKDSLEKGLPLERFSPEERTEIDYDYIHLFSVKSEEITRDDDRKRLYARLVCAVETMRQYRINITRSITSKNKELYITYKYPSSQYHYFENLLSSWAEIVYILERKPWWAEWEINALEEKFRSRITGENDVFFSEQYDDKEME